MSEENLQLYFKEFIKAESSSQGIDRTKKHPDYVCDLFVYEPRNVEEARLGTLFMLGKIENIPKNKYKNLDFLLSLLISVIKREFYSDSERPASRALEVSLNKANLYLIDFTEKGNTEWIGNLTFICGVFSKNTLHIAQVGKPMIKLFRGKTISHIENKFPDQKKPRPLKTFGNIASGAILNGDKIILSIKDILNVINLTNLRELSKGSCNQIIERVKKLIENKTSKTPMVCLVLEARESGEEVMVCSQAAQPIIKQKKKKNKSLIISRKIAILFLIGIYKAVYYIFKKLPKIKLPLPPALTRLKTQIINYKQNKPVFFTASILVILILALPFVAAQKINYHIKLNNFNRLSAEIQENQKKTDLALIYQEKEKARGLIQKNQALIADLVKYFEKSPLKNNSRILKKAAVLQEKYQNQQDSINNVIRIEELKEILNFSTSGFIVNPISISKIKDNLYFYELDSGILYRYNLSGEKKDLILIFISAKDELRKMISLENGQIVLFGQSEKVYLYNSSTNEHTIYLPDPVVPVEKIGDIKNFLSNFYILSTEGNIIKYSNELKGNSWLPEPSEELKNAQSMAIDGSIYILDSNGIIHRYFQGKKAEDIQPKLEKPLAEDNKIFVKSDFKNLYISDPKNQRIIILNKQGEIINQYVNDELINLEDFWVTENEKEVYLLCDKKVFKINL